jgi:3-isopropylmalate dehydrogenase
MSIIKKVAVLAGDGIGPEVIAEGLKVLRVLADALGVTLETHDALIGGL